MMPSMQLPYRTGRFLVTPPAAELILRHWTDLQDYGQIFEAMKTFTLNRNTDTADELWLLQHHPVLTQGQAGKPEHILTASDLPVVQSDRGGQVTWHGPGQLVGYFLFDLNRLQWHVRDLVNFAENLMLWLLAQYGIQAYTQKDAPGVYVDQRKIGSLGFKIRRGRSYHGIGLNIDCALQGFQTINPCGYAGLEMVRLSDLIAQPPSFAELYQLCYQFMQQQQLYQQIQWRAQ
jgi:lipoyl(octanoyl) transferase